MPHALEPGYIQICAWRMLTAAGNSAHDIARLTGHEVDHVTRVVNGARHSDVPGALGEDTAPDPRLHRARLELRRCLDLIDRGDDDGSDACWPSTGWTTSDNRAGRHSSFLGTSSLPRQVLMVTSGVLDPDPDWVAAHTCHGGANLCCRPEHLVWADRATNALHRRYERLGIVITGRSTEEIEHLDVSGRLLVDLELVARLEEALARLGPRGPQDDPCLVTEGIEHDHYTNVTFKGQRFKLHRFMLLAVGVDADGWIVQHRCDRPPCVGRLAHLSLGTASTNALDATAKGRRPVGGRHNRAHFSDPQVVAMGLLANQGATVSELHARFGGTRTSVVHALRGRTYIHVTRMPVALPVKVRLSDCGVKVVRALVACGSDEAVVAAMFRLSHPYVRDLAAGAIRADCGGVLTAKPGPAHGAAVATTVLGAAEHRYIAERVEDGVSLAAIAREVDVHPSTVERTQTRRSRCS